MWFWFGLHEELNTTNLHVLKQAIFNESSDWYVQVYRDKTLSPNKSNSVLG